VFIVLQRVIGLKLFQWLERVHPDYPLEQAKMPFSLIGWEEPLGGRKLKKSNCQVESNLNGKRKERYQKGSSFGQHLLVPRAS